MVYYCDAAECTSHSAKAKKLHIYPFMANVTWVKWPKNPNTQRRWKKLIRRDGRDKSGRREGVLSLTRNSRLCSRHFGKDQLSSGGYVSGDPVYFAWNNWGRPLKSRSSSALVKMEAGRSRPAVVARIPPVFVYRGAAERKARAAGVPESGTEVEIRTCESASSSRSAEVGVMYPFWERTAVPQLADHHHDYICTSSPKRLDVCVQTDLTADDITTLQELARKLLGVTSASPASDQRVDGLTEPDSKESLDVLPADVQQLRVLKEETPFSPVLDQQDPEPTSVRIKEEQEELWTSQDGPETDVSRSSFTVVTVKTEENEEKPPSSEFQSGEEPSAADVYSLHVHTGVHTEEKPIVYVAKRDADSPIAVHAGETQHGSGANGKGPGGKPSCEAQTAEKSFSCSVCGKTFQYQGYLKKHMCVHAEKRQFHCETCKKRFRCQYDLDRHMRIHSRGGVFRCSICGKTYKYRINIKRHMSVHTGEKPFSCDVCGKSFIQGTALRTHMRVHTGEKPFRCDICGDTFTQSGSLKIHMRVHTGEKPFRCDVCNKAFAQSGTLRKHMTLHEARK